MTECQKLMCSACFGGMIGLITSEVCFVVAELVLYIRDKRRKRGGRKSSPAAE